VLRFHRPCRSLTILAAATGVSLGSAFVNADTAFGLIRRSGLVLTALVGDRPLQSCVNAGLTEGLSTMMCPVTTDRVALAGIRNSSSKRPSGVAGTSSAAGHLNARFPLDRKNAPAHVFQGGPAGSRRHASPHPVPQHYRIKSGRQRPGSVLPPEAHTLASARAGNMLQWVDYEHAPIAVVCRVNCWASPENGLRRQTSSLPAPGPSPPSQSTWPQ